MIVAEYKNTGVTVRIHDDHYSGAIDQRLLELSHIVSDSYKRRKMEDKPSIAAVEMIDETAQAVL